MAAKPLHIAMFPWLAFGHIMPYLDLAKLIAGKGHTISFLTTPRNIQRLPKLPPEYSSSISFVAIPLPSVPGLPAGAEATMDIQGATEMGLLKKAFDGLEPAVVRFLEAAVPDWIITDFAPYWLPPATARLGISSAFFFIINAWFLSFFGAAEDLVSGSDYRTRPEDFMVPPRWIKFDTRLAYRRFEANWAVGTGQNDESGLSDHYRVGKTIIGGDAILIRHCHEFEPDWLPLLEELHHRRVVPLGLMPPQVDSAGDDDEAWIPIKSWLDRKEKGSVVYVAFGSEVTLTREQLTELAHGLELSNVPFFWALRRITDSAVLPNGFEERVMGRGIVWKSWAPQLKILSHGSVGGFLTHCGWSSIVEGLMCGHPLITLPFLVDQGLNSRIIVDKGLAYEVARDEENGAYTRESVAESMRAVMRDDKGGKLRERAKEVSKVFGDRELHSKYIDKFVEYLVDHTREKMLGHEDDAN
ncbi:putative UDP-rhamnose:rhamnosyltransferase 1 [Andrographis paniculata]|uniref:putative UDP-rhamnose:rhamnosyltransferase 1 n=1 Tax=Andrographis paniculata TaxID=175694 RepID=UPI0021E902BF|nr:putative UDP-rhamnose:rhamnosyltransferase 1 [Andrographis paniculata]